MASHSGQRDDGGFYITSKTPHFFKIMFKEAIQHGKLKIPAKFVREYGSGISSPVFLKVPSGATWRVELTESDSGVWLQSGWSDFIKHYSIKLNDFVVFRYEGHCVFSVIIFSKSASEIKYLIPNKQQSGVENFNEQSQRPATTTTTKEELNTSVEILDNGMPPSKKRRGKSPLPCTRPSMKRITRSSTNRTKSSARLHTLASKSVSEGIKGSNNELEDSKTRVSDATREHKQKRTMGTIKGMARNEVLRRAGSSFKSQNPHFMVVIQPSFVIVRGRYSLPVPVPFTREYLMDKPGKILCVVDGKSWCMELVVNVIAKNNTLEVKLCNGWIEFVRGNNLAVGDVCVFELVKSTKITFKVAIIRSE